jgi:hypothetical protein
MSPLLSISPLCCIIGDMEKTNGTPSRRPPEPSALRSTHELKSWPDSFAAVVTGRKRYEIRRHDRNFQEGDAILLLEFDPNVRGDDVDPYGYTGRKILCFVGRLEYGPPLPVGWCAFDIISADDAIRCAPAVLRGGAK